MWECSEFVKQSLDLNVRNVAGIARSQKTAEQNQGQSDSDVQCPSKPERRHQYLLPA
jgi:hypothetical protein